VKLLRHDLHTLTGVYALDAIDGSERERFEHHLLRCQPCDNQVRGLQATATRLAQAVAARPPEEMKVRVLAAVARTRQHQPPVFDSRPLPAAPGGWARRLAVPVAAASLALAIVLSVLLGVSRHQLGVETAQQRAIAAVLTAPDARLATEPTSVGGVATVVIAPNLRQFIFTSKGLPALAAAKVYQLWVLGPGGTATSAGLLRASGNGQTAPVLVAGLLRGDKVGVTVEPAGGTTKPTTTPIVVITAAS
jgi:anti-sigma-K factor RskA